MSGKHSAEGTLFHIFSLIVTKVSTRSSRRSSSASTCGAHRARLHPRRAGDRGRADPQPGDRGGAPHPGGDARGLRAPRGRRSPTPASTAPALSSSRFPRATARSPTSSRRRKASRPSGAGPGLHRRGGSPASGRRMLWAVPPHSIGSCAATGSVTLAVLARCDRGLGYVLAWRRHGHARPMGEMMMGMAACPGLPATSA